MAVHGITDEFLADKPRFAEVVDEFFEFIKGAELIIHNAAFDIGFINHEFALLKGRSDLGEVRDHCTVLDTLLMARERHPGQRNNLDALCKRYGVDNSGRDLHGALLDAEILADVYLAMTGGQTSLSLAGQSGEDGGPGATAAEIRRLPADRPRTTGAARLGRGAGAARRAPGRSGQGLRRTGALAAAGGPTPTRRRDPAPERGQGFRAARAAATLKASSSAVPVRVPEGACTRT